MNLFSLHQPRTHRYVDIAGRQCLDTGAVVIGRAYVPPSPRVISRDAETVQSALLDPRTSERQTTLQRLAGVAWKWC
jgi:hypothetical protein